VLDNGMVAIGEIILESKPGGKSTGRRPRTSVSSSAGVYPVRAGMVQKTVDLVVPAVPISRAFEPLSGCRGGENQFLLPDTPIPPHRDIGCCLDVDHCSLLTDVGMTLDPVTGLYCARNRSYSPSLGRWINQDPAGYINGANRPILAIDDLGNTTATTFDNNGNPVGITRTELSTITQPVQSAEVFVTLMAWDCMNRQVLLSQSGPDGSIASQKGINLARITLTGYDSRGNATLNVDPKGNTTITLWDGANRRLETRQHLRQNGLGGNPPVNNGNGSSTTLNTSGQGQIAGSIATSFEYDGNSNQIAMVDDRGGVTRWAFDSHDRKTSGSETGT